MKKIIGILVFMFLFLGQICYSNAETITGGDQIFDVNHTITYTNRLKKPINLKITLPIVKDFKPHQEVLKIDISPKPQKIEDRPTGKVALFELKNIEPGKTVKWGFKAVIATKRVYYDISPSRLTGKCPPNIKQFLASDARFPVSDPQIKQLVQSVTAGEPSKFYQILKFYDFIRGFNFQLTKNPAPVLETIKTRVVQCSDATELFIVLCRCIGIPARYCGGVYLKESLTQTTDTHAWAEIWLDPYGWVPVDPTMGRFDENSRLSRFCEIDSPYILLWRDLQNPYNVESDSGVTLGPADFKVSMNYKARKNRTGLSLKKIYPGLSFNLKKVPAPQIMSSNGQAKDLYLAADKDFNNGNLNLAEKNIRSAISLDPGFILAYRKLVQIYEKKNRLVDLKKELEPSLKTPSSKVAVGYALGVINTQLANYSVAESQLTQSLKDGAPAFIIEHNRGIFYKKTKQISSSARHFNLSLRLNPQGIATYRSFIELVEYLEDYPTKISICTTAMKFAPSPEFQSEIAKSYIAMKEYNQAISAANKAIKMSPMDGSLYGILSLAYIEIGNGKKARENFDKAVKFGITAEQKEFLQNKMKNIK